MSDDPLFQTAAKDLDEVAAVVAAFNRALSLNPNDFFAHFEVGRILYHNALIDDAIVAFSRAITINQHFAPACFYLGIALGRRQRWDEAAAVLRRAGKLDPTLGIDRVLQLASRHRRAGQSTAAAHICRLILVIDPRYEPALRLLGMIHLDNERTEKAIDLFRESIAIEPGSASAYSILAFALGHQGMIDEAIKCFERAVDLVTENPAVHSNLLFALHFHPDYTLAMIAAESRRWNDRHGVPLAQSIRPHAHDSDPNRKLRIGCVSPDFFDHLVGTFLLPLIESHDRERFEIFAFANITASDAITAQLKSRSDNWREIGELSDQQAADMVREDRIDILVARRMEAAYRQLWQDWCAPARQ